MISIARVCPADMEQFWPVVSRLLAKATALSRGRYEIADLAEKLRSGEFELVVIKDGPTIITALTMIIRTYPRMKVLEILYLGGERFEDWKDQLDPMLDTIARAADCAKIEFIGRAGWGRLLRPFGYERAFVSYEKIVS